ncbi:MAG: tyrosine-type recombinase/integrase [Flavobacteriales bacterium]|nr:tyrosine-type recombinase/integrase [Flavobacteriales bacterium]
MSLKGTITTSDYIDFDRATAQANKLIREAKNELMGLYILVSINTGLRTSDVLGLTWKQLRNEKLNLVEKKTKKNREIILNDNITSAVEKMGGERDGFVFLSQKGSVFSRQQINRNLKKVFSRENKKLNISTHSLRKSFGRRVYTNNGESEKALIYLSELFNHTSLSITRVYLGLRQEELDNIYLNL